MADTKKKQADPFMIFTGLVGALAVATGLWAALSGWEWRSLRRANAAQVSDMQYAESLLHNYPLQLLAPPSDQANNNAQGDIRKLDQVIKDSGKNYGVAWQSGGLPKVTSTIERQDAKARIKNMGNQFIPFLQDIESQQPYAYLYRLSASREGGPYGRQPGPAQWDVSLSMKAPGAVKTR